MSVKQVEGPASVEAARRTADPLLCLLVGLGAAYVVALALSSSISSVC